MISQRVRAEIRRLYTVEGWRLNTIARHLGVHHSTVRRALEREGIAQPKIQRPSMIDPFVSLIRDTLKRYPELPASTLYEMVRRRGYPGRPDHFRHRVAELGLRPRKAPEAFLQLRTLPGEQAQVDWAYFGQRKVEGGVRRLWAFVMVSSYSRAIFFRFFYDARLPNFLTGHVGAFAAFGGCARILLYDNLKSAVLEREDRAVRFHPRLLEMADHYGFEPRPVAPYRGNEKGRVERAIRFLRTSFFPLRKTWSLEALNEAAAPWCRIAARRPWPQDRRRTVEQAAHEERRHLLSLPPEPFQTHERLLVKVRRTPYVQVDANRYSIPHDRIQRSLTVLAELDRVRIFDGQELIATHPRCWGKQQVLEDPTHTDELWRAKRNARRHRGQDRLSRSVPRSEELLLALAQRQRHLATAVQHLIFLLDTYGADELRHAVNEALDCGSPHPETVRLVLERRRQRTGEPPPIEISLANPRIAALDVEPHPLADYDPTSDEDEDEDETP